MAMHFGLDRYFCAFCEYFPAYCFENCRNLRDYGSAPTKREDGFTPGRLAGNPRELAVLTLFHFRETRGISERVGSSGIVCIQHMSIETLLTQYTSLTIPIVRRVGFFLIEILDFSYFLFP